MTWGLFEKEFRQHAFSFFILTLVLASGSLLLEVYGPLQRIAGSPLHLFRLELSSVVLVAGALLAHLLVTTEYRNRTQLFLEGLPVEPVRVIVVKYLTGLAIL